MIYCSEREQLHLNVSCRYDHEGGLQRENQSLSHSLFSLNLIVCVFLYSSLCHSSYSSVHHLCLQLTQIALLQCTTLYFLIVLGKSNLLMMQIPRLFYLSGCLSEDVLNIQLGHCYGEKARDAHIS